MDKQFTVKHKLNKFLKPIVDPNDDNIKMYPVYAQVILNRDNYLFPSATKAYSTDLELVDDDLKARLKEEVDLITSLIRYELREKGKEFSLRGLGKSYTNYRSEVHIYWNDLLRSELKKIVRKSGSAFYETFHYDNVKLDPGILFHAIRQVIPDLKDEEKFTGVGKEIEIFNSYKKMFQRRGKEPFVYPSFFHWLSEGHSKKLEKKMIKKGSIEEQNLRDGIYRIERNIRMATVDGPK